MRRGTKHSEKTKRKIAESLKGHPCYKNPDRNRKLSELHKGRKLSEKTKKKIGKSMQGKNYGDQVVVHHINGNHSDDRAENRLEMTRREHSQLHFRQGDFYCLGRQNG